MVAPATEIATIPLISGANIEDVESSAGKVWQSTLDTVAAQDGYQRAYFGRQVESPNVVDLFVDWDSYEAHQKFVASAIYDPFVKHLMTIVDGAIGMQHANFTPHPPSAAVGTTRAPVTEVCTAYFTSHDDAYAGNAAKASAGMEVAEGFKGASGGWVIEDAVHEEKLGKDVKGKAYVCLFGWESVDAHMAFRKTTQFAEVIPLLRGGAEGLVVHHTSFAEQ